MTAARVEGSYNIDATSGVWGHVNILDKFAAVAYDSQCELAKVHFKNTFMLTYMHGSSA